MVKNTNIIIAGPRSFINYKAVAEQLNIILPKYNNIKIISGGAIGVDQSAINYAIANNITYNTFLPNYSKYGKTAPIMRNLEMAKIGNVLIAFYNGFSKGTSHMINFAHKFNLKIHIIKI